MRRTQLLGAQLLLLLQAIACASPNIGRDMRHAAVYGGGTGPLIEVQPFEVGSTVALPPGAYFESIDVQVADALVRHLRERGHRAALTAPGATPVGDVIVRGQIVKVAPGSSAARGWSGGFGAGGAAFGVTGQFVRPSGLVLDQFDDERWSGRAIEVVVVMTRCVDRVALDLAEQIVEADWSH